MFLDTYKYTLKTKKEGRIAIVIQSNLSLTATLETEKSGHCSEVAVMGR